MDVGKSLIGIDTSDQDDAEWLTPRVAAGLCGVSYVTIKNWILRGTLPTTKTPGEHHRIAARDLAKFAPAVQVDLAKKRSPQISGRNQLQGIVTEVTVMACWHGCGCASAIRP